MRDEKGLQIGQCGSVWERRRLGNGNGSMYCTVYQAWTSHGGGETKTRGRGALGLSVDSVEENARLAGLASPYSDGCWPRMHA